MPSNWTDQVGRNQRLIPEDPLESATLDQQDPLTSRDRGRTDRPYQSKEAGQLKWQQRN